MTALIWSYSLLAQGSVFFHASQTKLGGRADMTTMNLFALVNYQAAISSLNISNESSMFLLNSSRTGIEMALEVKRIYNDLPVLEWREALKSLGIPGFIQSICAFLSLAFSMIMSKAMVETLIGTLLHKL